MRLNINPLSWWRRSSAESSVDARRRPAGAAVKLAERLDVYARNRLPRTLQYPRTTLGAVIDQTARRWGASPAVVYGEMRRDYAGLWSEVNRLAAGLAELGVRAGDRVLITLPNCPEYLTVFFAVQKLGAVVVNAGPLMGADDLKKLMQMTRPRVAVALDLQAASLQDAAAELDELTWVWVSLEQYQTLVRRFGYLIRRWQSGVRGANHRHETLERVLSRASSRPPTVEPNDESIAVLQPTGGTSGVLRVAKLSHRNLLSNAVQLSMWVRQQAGQERVLAVLPMFHVYGLTTCVVSPVVNAGAVLPMTRFRAGAMLELIRRHEPTVLPLVPAIFEALSDALEERAQPEVCAVLRRGVVTSGAAPLSPTTQRRFEKVTGSRIVQGYGLTEASPVTHVNPPAATREGSIGVALPDTICRVVDLEDGRREVAPGEAGELMISGPQVMHGYLDNPVETSAVLHVDRDGRRWLRTGDVVRVDDDGYYAVIDRRKEMIIRGGLKVWPAKVERVLKLHPAVADVAVVGRADPTHTEAVVALVSTKSPVNGQAEALIDALRALCREHLAKYEVPSQIELVAEVPRTALGKHQKFRLKAAESQAAAAAAPSDKAIEKAEVN